MDIEGFRALLTPAGQDLLAAAGAADASDAGLLAAASRLRERHPAGPVAAALTQVRLRARARDKFGPDAGLMYFTPDGLEQATRAAVADHRARRFAAYLGAMSLGAGPVLEAGCGIGADLIARARAGVRGAGVEIDPLTAEVAAANLAALGLAGPASVRAGDARSLDPRGYGAVFADPGRRTGRGRVFDPRAYEPPLEVVRELAERAPAGCLKVAPGIPDEAIAGRGPVEAEWISVGGEVKEAALWLGGLAGDVGRRATLLPRGAMDGGGAATLVRGPGLDPPRVRPWGRYLYEPDGAVIRAHLVAEAAALVDGGLADPDIAYITADALVRTPFAAAYEIEDVLPFSAKRLRAELRRRGVGSLTIKKRGSAVDVEKLRRDLRPRGDAALTVVLTRVGRAPVALLTRPAAATRHA